MPKTSIKRSRLLLHGPTMGTRWSASFYVPDGEDPRMIRLALQAAVDEVDWQMSCWNPTSDLMRLNVQPVRAWAEVPRRLMDVLRLALEIGRLSGGAFDIGVGAAVRAWGFGSEPLDEGRIQQALKAQNPPASEVVELDIAGGRARRMAPVQLDLNGIAKGYGVDRLKDVLTDFGISSGLVGIDGELRAFGLHPGGEPWTVAVEAPDPDRRSPHAILALENAAAATSGDYRHWLIVGGRRYAHTMDPRRGAPLPAAPASVTIVARSCAEADAWATALMVLGWKDGSALAERIGLNALFLLRDGDQLLRSQSVGQLFRSRQKERAQDQAIRQFEETKVRD